MENREEIKKTLNTKKVAILVLGLAVVVAAGIFVYSTYSNLPVKNKGSEVVALVGDKKIMRSELDFQIEQTAAGQQIPLPEEGTAERGELELKVLDQIIELTLLLKDAESQDIVATKEEIDASYSMVAAQTGGEEVLKQELQKVGMTQEQLRKELEIEIVVGQYFNFLKEKYKITVSQEEIEAFYEEQVAVQQPEVELGLVELQIRQYLEQQKLEQPIFETFQRLREEIEIEIYL